ncbi:MAG TPA: hypothetical protein VMI31_05845, partial [Fimbriimonadaceae bacterium]|nr:hypothetical protein [Fimbriimonadaceae bacterium]
MLGTSWLPHDVNPGGTPGGFSIRPLVCDYAGTELVRATPFSHGRAAEDGQVWSSSIQTKEGDGVDIECTFVLRAGAAKSAGVAVAFDFSHWSPRNYVLVPAVLYDGNRFRILPIGYPPYIRNPADRPIDMPVTVTDIPHLNPGGAHAKVEMMTGNCATPMMSFFDPSRGRGFILLTEQGTRFGNSGMMVEEDAGTGRMSFVVSAPCVRGQRYVMCGRAPSGDRAADWKQGDSLTLRFRVYDFTCQDLAAFYDKAFSVRKALSGQNSFACVTPYSACADLILKHFDKDKWFQGKRLSYICNRPGDMNPYSHQIGWGSIPILSFPSVIDETPERLRRVCDTMDAVVAAQGKTGLFHAVNRDGEIL